MVEFPINRRHQGLATMQPATGCPSISTWRFQSIGVTKDWRYLGTNRSESSHQTFPINRGHQGLATRYVTVAEPLLPPCFQSIGATKDWRLAMLDTLEIYPQMGFPINRCHQGLATVICCKGVGEGLIKFPINWRHQGLATFQLGILRTPGWVVSNQ